MFLYYTNIVSRIKSPIKYAFNVITPEEELFEASATTLQATEGCGNLVFDIRKNGYPIILKSQEALSNDEFEKIYESMDKTNLVTIRQNYIETMPLLYNEEMSEHPSNFLFSYYSGNIQTYGTSPNVTYLQNHSDFVLDPLQEVTHVVKFSERHIPPEDNIILYEPNKNSADYFVAPRYYYTKNLLYKSKYEKTVLVMGDGYFSINAHCGFLIKNENVIYFVSEHIMVRSFGNPGQISLNDVIYSEFSNKTCISIFMKLVQEYNFDTFESFQCGVYAFDLKTLMFMGEFPDHIATTKISEIYLSTFAKFQIAQ